jgi:hypothetical protein
MIAAGVKNAGSPRHRTKNGAGTRDLLGFLPFGRHLLSRQEEELCVLRIHATKEIAELIENTGILAGMSLHLKYNTKLPTSLIEIVNRPDSFSECVLNPSCLTLIGVRLG